MRPHEIKTTIKAGVFILILTFGGAIITFMIGKESSVFQEKAIIYTEVNDAKFLKEGAPVLLNGIKIGKVVSIEMQQVQNIKISLSILETFLPLIKTDSYCSIVTIGMLGDKYIGITGGSPTSESLKPGMPLKFEEKGEVTAFIDRGQDLLIKANQSLIHLNSLLTEINKNSNIGDTLHNINQVTKNFNNLTKGLTKLTYTYAQFDLKKVEDKLVSTLDNVQKLTSQINKGPGTLHSLIYDPSLHDDMRSLMGGAQRNKLLKYFIRESIKNSDGVNQDD